MIGFSFILIFLMTPLGLKYKIFIDHIHSLNSSLIELIAYWLLELSLKNIYLIIYFKPQISDIKMSHEGTTESNF